MKINIDLTGIKKLQKLKKVLETYNNKCSAYVGSYSPVLKEHIQGNSGRNLPSRDPLIEPNKTNRMMNIYKQQIKQAITSEIEARHTMLLIAEKMKENTYQVMSTGGNGDWEGYSYFSAKHRERKGLRTDVVNLEETGKMKRSIFSDVVSK